MKKCGCVRPRRRHPSHTRPTALAITSALASALLFSCGWNGSNALGASAPVFAPELSLQRVDLVSNLVSRSLGDASPTANIKNPDGAKRKDGRYASARAMALELAQGGTDRNGGAVASRPDVIPPHELVYGELSVPTLARILDAVGVRNGDKFLDIGSGDGGLVLAASLLYSGSSGDGDGNAISVARGIEIVPGLVERSVAHVERMNRILASSDGGVEGGGERCLPLLSKCMAPIEFFLGDVHTASTDGSSISALLADTTLALCFATTWSAGNNYSSAIEKNGGNRMKQNTKTSLGGRALPKLSKSLSLLPTGSRIVVVDGRLSTKDDFLWEGDLRIQCPDTAPFSVASLYERR